MGRVKSSSFFSFDSEKCFCSLFAFPASKSCCDDESTLIKIEDDQALAWTVSVTPEFYSIYELTLPVSDNNSEVSRPVTIEDNGPPGNPTPLFVKHCSLILYSEESIA